MYIIIFEYFVLKGKSAAFEQLYGPEGEWVQLFRKGQGYISTELLKNPEDPHHYLTIDKWNSEDQYHEFMHHFQKEYQKIDVMGDNYTFDQRRTGTFSLISG